MPDGNYRRLNLRGKYRARHNPRMAPHPDTGHPSSSDPVSSASRRCSSPRRSALPPISTSDLDNLNNPGVVSPSPSTSRQKPPLYGRKICATQLSPEQIDTVKSSCALLKASFTPALYPDTDFLLAAEVGSPKYSAAIANNITVVHPDWLTELRSRWVSIANIPADLLVSQYRLPPFQGLQFVFQGFESSDTDRMNMLQSLVTQNGGSISPVLTKDTNVFFIVGSSHSKLASMILGNPKIPASQHMFWPAWIIASLNAGGSLGPDSSAPFVWDPSTAEPPCPELLTPAPPSLKPLSPTDPEPDAQPLKKRPKLRSLVDASRVLPQDLASPSPLTPSTRPASRLANLSSTSFTVTTPKLNAFQTKTDLFRNLHFSLSPSLSRGEESAAHDLILRGSGVLIPSDSDASKINETLSSNDSHSILNSPTHTALDSLPIHYTVFPPFVSNNPTLSSTQPVTLAWIHFCLHKAHILPPNSNHPLQPLFTPLDFDIGNPSVHSQLAELRVSASGFPALELSLLTRFLESLGVDFSSSFDASYSCLLVADPYSDSQKARHALNNNIPILSLKAFLDRFVFPLKNRSSLMSHVALYIHPSASSYHAPFAAFASKMGASLVLHPSKATHSAQIIPSAASRKKTSGPLPVHPSWIVQSYDTSSCLPAELFPPQLDLHKASQLELSSSVASQVSPLVLSHDSSGTDNTPDSNERSIYTQASEASHLPQTPEGHSKDTSDQPSDSLVSVKPDSGHYREFDPDSSTYSASINNTASSLRTDELSRIDEESQGLLAELERAKNDSNALSRRRVRKKSSDRSFHVPNTDASPSTDPPPTSLSESDPAFYVSFENFDSAAHRKRVLARLTSN